jgi:hypothetical protein
MSISAHSTIDQSYLNSKSDYVVLIVWCKTKSSCSSGRIRLYPVASIALSVLDHIY